LASIPLHASGSNLVQNPGFEDGTFANWTNSTDWSIYSTGIDGPDYSDPGPNSGTYAAQSSCIGATCISGPTSILSQDLTTVPGQEYLFSFYYTSNTQVFEDASTPNELLALWGGTQVDDIVNQPGDGVWQSFSVIVTATSTTTEIQFNGRDDPAFVFIDDVSVEAIPEPSTLALTGLGALAAALYLWRARRT